jgi:hypothetical protein
VLNNSNRLTLATRYELRHMDRRMLCPLSHTPACDEPTFGVMTRTNWLLTSLHVDLIAYARAHMTECQPKACGPANPDRRLSAFATIDARSPSDGAPWASKPSVVPIENVSLRFKG